MLTCGCDEYPEASWDSWQSARKEYQCCECGHTIKTGEQYWRNFQIYDGMASTFHRCERCADLADAMRDLGYCDYLGGLFEAYQEWLDMEAKLDENGEYIRDPSDQGSRILLKHKNWQPEATS